MYMYIYIYICSICFACWNQPVDIPMFGCLKSSSINCTPNMLMLNYPRLAEQQNL